MEEDLAAAKRWNRAVDVVERPVAIRDLIWHRASTADAPRYRPGSALGHCLGFLVAVVGGVLLGSRRTGP